MCDTARMSSAKRIAMWSGPRCHSTALMRAFENRADTRVVDEPLFGPYLAATGLEHPVAPIVIEEQGADPVAAVRRLADGAAECAGVQFEKHMAHHLLEGFDRAWMADVRHGFLVREPREVLASYTKKREVVRLEDLGVRQQLALYHHVTAELGQAAPVITARQLLQDPRATLARLCAGLGLDFDEAMLAWPAGRRDSDGVWAGWWYDKLMRSTGFFAYQPKRVELDAELEAIAAAAAPFFDELRAIAEDQASRASSR